MASGVGRRPPTVDAADRALWSGVALAQHIPGFPDALDALSSSVTRALAGLPGTVEYVVCHLLPPDGDDLLPRAGLSIRVRGDDGPPASADVVAAALGGVLDSRLAEAGARRRTGTCLVFPGQEILHGALPVYRILETDIDRVTLRAAELGLGDLVDLTGPVRPVFELGLLVLRVTRADGGRLVPVDGSRPVAMSRGARF